MHLSIHNQIDNSSEMFHLLPELFFSPTLYQGIQKLHQNSQIPHKKKKNRSIDISQSAEKPKVSTTPQEAVKGKTLTKEDTAKAQKSAQEWARKKIQEELEIDNSKKLIKKNYILPSF